MNISPVETPFISNAGKGTATQTNHEWQTDALEAAAANAQIEGNDYTLDTRAATDRLSNYCQEEETNLHTKWRKSVKN